MFSYSGIVNHLLKDKQKLCRRNLRKPQYYDYPAGKRITPFQKAGGDSYFMGAGDIFTYLGNYEEIGNIIDPSDERSRQIQGAYVLNIFKRHSVIDSGEFNAALQFKQFDSAEKAISYAIKVSSEQAMKCVVVQWFGDLDRY